MTYNQILIRLLTLLDKRRHGLSHADYFYVGIFSNELIQLPTYIIETDTINIKLITDKDIANFINYDLIIFITIDNKNELSIKPLSYFYSPKYFTLDNSLKLIHITCNKFYVPLEIIYNDNFILPIEKSINILKEEK